MPHSLLSYTLLFLIHLTILTHVVFGQESISPDSVGISQHGLTKLESYWQSQIDSRQVPGAVSMIYRNGHLAHYKAMGFSDLQDSIPMQKDQIFFIQSMTKPIVSVAVMMLYEEGKISLHDPVANYLPHMANLKVATAQGDSLVPLRAPITVWHLLTHTSGLSHGLEATPYDQALFQSLYEYEHQSLQSRVDSLLQYPLLFQPGEAWYYSAAPDILVLLIEEITGQSIDNYLQERIFTPLGMRHTAYNLPDSLLDRLVGLHQVDSTGRVQPIADWQSAQGNTVLGGTHGLYSTAADYMEFCKMLLHGGTLNGKRILSRKTIDLITADHISHLAYKRGWGFGLGFGVLLSPGDAAHIGSPGMYTWGGAFNTYFIIDPAEKLIAIHMMQYWPYGGKFSRKEQFMRMVYTSLSD